MIPPSTGISNRRCVSVPEVSSGVWARFPTEYIGSNETACSVALDMTYPQSSESGVPPITSHQRSQPYTGPTQNHPSTAPVFPPTQSSCHTHARPEGIASALTDLPPHPAPVPPITQRASFMGNAHPHLQMVHSPPFAFPRHVVSPGQEENMQHVAYVSPSMMITLRPHAPLYQYQIPPDHVPTPPHVFPPTVPTSPIYSHPHPPINTSPPLNFPPPLRHTVSGSSISELRSSPYATHGAYTPMGYTTPPSYAYPSPTPFVPAPSIYGSPHYAQPYGYTGQEGQGAWWYLSPGTSPSNSFEGTQREFQSWSTAGYLPAGQLEGEQPGQANTVLPPSEAQPARRSTDQTRIGRPLNDAKQAAAQAPFPTTSPSRARTMATEVPSLGKNKHQERRPYHPNPPAHRSEWVMWAGNVPSDVTHDELREFFNQPLPPPSPTQKGLPKDRQQVYGGVSTVFIISRSNCAFVNFGSGAQLEAATARFNGQPIRPDDQRCPRLVCRVRRREDDLMAGVGAQRGSAMHIKWVKEQKLKVQREQANTAGPPKDMAGPSLSLPVSSDDDRETGRVFSLSRSASIASTNSDILTRYFPQRYFLLKSSTQYHLDLSTQKNVWETQRHNEEILDQAYRTSKDVFLIFSVNKSGEFYGYARMAGPILQDEFGVYWASATGSPPPSSVSSLNEMGAGAYVSPDDTGAKRQDPLYILPPDQHRVVEQPPHSAPVGQPYEPRQSDHRLTNSMPNPSTSPLRTAVPVWASPSELSLDAVPHSIEDQPARGTRESAGNDAIAAPIHGDQEIFEPDLDDRPKPVSKKSFEDRDARDDGTRGRPFRIEWIRTTSLPFFRTRHLQNPWNHGREVKISRDGTELEPTVGQQLLDEWDRPSVSVDNSPGPSRTTERRRGSKFAQHRA